MASTSKPGHGLLAELYPAGGWRRWLFRAPLVLWRMGLGWLLPRQMLVLATTGRKSGLPRYVMIEHFKADNAIYFVSGWGKQAQWVKNIQADPLVTVETVRDGVVTGTVRRVISEDEFRKLWPVMQQSPMFDTQLRYWGMQPTLDDFLAKRDRALIFTLEPGHVPAPPPLQRDLQWVTVVVGGLLLLRLLRGGQKKR